MFHQYLNSYQIFLVRTCLDFVYIKLLFLDLDLSANDLPAVPDVVYRLKALKRLNLNDNQITDLTGQSG